MGDTGCSSISLVFAIIQQERYVVLVDFVQSFDGKVGYNVIVALRPFTREMLGSVCAILRNFVFAKVFNFLSIKLSQVCSVRNVLESLQYDALVAIHIAENNPIGCGNVFGINYYVAINIGKSGTAPTTHHTLNVRKGGNVGKASTRFNVFYYVGNIVVYGVVFKGY